MDVDCRRPRHDENYSSLFVENSHPETLHRDMCIACSGSSSGLRLPPLRTMPIHKIVSKERCQSYFIDGCRRIKIERNNLLCEQAPTEVFRSIFAWLVTFKLAKSKIPPGKEYITKLSGRYSKERSMITAVGYFVSSAASVSSVSS